MGVQDDANKQLIEKQQEDNDAWQKKYKKMYRDIKSEQIVEEKKRYELYIKVKEQNSVLKQTKRDLRDREKQLDLLKHEHAVALSKKQIIESGSGSFTTNSLVSNTPSPPKRDRPALSLGVVNEEDENGEVIQPAEKPEGLTIQVME